MMDYGDPQDADWEFEKRADRRTFFHGEGKSLTFMANPNKRHASNDMLPVGTQVTLQVEEIHFGNPRVGVASNNPAPMKVMNAWKAEDFAKHTLECAQIAFGDYWVWCAQGIRSNRILYAAKRTEQPIMSCTVVAAPRIANADEEIDLTYGASIQGIQLVPL